MHENIDDDGRIVTTRKPHHCEWCGGVIEAGEKAIVRVYKWEGDFHNRRMHPECFKAMGRSEFIEGGFSPGYCKRGKSDLESEVEDD